MNWLEKYNVEQSKSEQMSFYEKGCPKKWLCPHRKPPSTPWQFSPRRSRGDSVQCQVQSFDDDPILLEIMCLEVQPPFFRGLLTKRNFL